ncbi:MAG TPA: hypothetical protein VIS94_03230 [Desulfomonilia bacterium]
MAHFNPFHKSVLRAGSDIADSILMRNTRTDFKNRYDVSTLADGSDNKGLYDSFARLMSCEVNGRIIHYRICLNDEDIMEFLRHNSEIDMLTFIVFVMTHELVHIHRFSMGEADFDKVDQDEEIIVDNLTRLFLAKYPPAGRERVFRLLDKLTPPPLYNHRTIFETGGRFNAYL